MIYYTRQGELPNDKHTVFQIPNSEGIYYEELASLGGFAGLFSTKYHCSLPTSISGLETVNSSKNETVSRVYQNSHFYLGKLPENNDFYLERALLLKNENNRISFLKINQKNTGDDKIFFKNAYHHELFFVAEGKGTLKSEYGNLSFTDGDYLLVPKSTIYQIEIQTKITCILFEDTHQFKVPEEYLNCGRQLNEISPYSERDFGIPVFQQPIIKNGEYELLVKFGETYSKNTLNHHPFDLIGYDGYLYPLKINIKDFKPIVGKVHLPPTAHNLFVTENCAVCNFVPRLFDFHSQAIPAPYSHSNIDCDEVIFYVEGNFISRKGVEKYSLTHHPSGSIHGPQPGKTEESIGKKDVFEFAVMIDTFKPLLCNEMLKGIEDKTYYKSWDQ